MPEAQGRQKSCHLEPKRQQQGISSSKSQPSQPTIPSTNSSGQHNIMPLSHSIPSPSSTIQPKKRRRRIKRSGLFALSLLFLAAALLMLSNEYLLSEIFDQIGDLTPDDMTRAALMRDTLPAVYAHTPQMQSISESLPIIDGNERLQALQPAPTNIEFDEERTVTRLKEMTNVTEKMKHQPFGNQDGRFGEHGSHKGSSRDTR